MHAYVDLIYEWCCYERRGTGGEEERMIYGRGGGGGDVGGRRGERRAQEQVCPPPNGGFLMLLRANINEPIVVVLDCEATRVICYVYKLFALVQVSSNCPGCCDGIFLERFRLLIAP